jgi:hypothetical protein
MRAEPSGSGRSRRAAPLCHMVCQTQTAHHQRRPDCHLDSNRVSCHDQEAARIMRDALMERVQGLEDDPIVQAVMVVTHVPIFRAQKVTKPGDRRWAISNAYFGNPTLGDRLTRMSKLRRVVSRHTHCGREGSSSGTVCRRSRCQSWPATVTARLRDVRLSHPAHRSGVRHPIRDMLGSDPCNVSSPALAHSLRVLTACSVLTPDHAASIICHPLRASSLFVRHIPPPRYHSV